MRRTAAWRSPIRGFPIDGMTVEIGAPFEALRLAVTHDLVDHNGHMGIRSYTRLFDQATGPFYAALGLSRETLARHGATVFALQDTSWYIREVLLDDPLLITAQLVDHDHNKIVSFMTMIQERQSYVAASFELIEILMDRETRRPRRFPEAIACRLAAVNAAHDSLGRPSLSGRGIGIRR